MFSHGNSEQRSGVSSPWLPTSRPPSADSDSRSASLGYVSSSSSLSSIMDEKLAALPSFFQSATSGHRRNASQVPILSTLPQRRRIIPMFVTVVFCLLLYSSLSSSSEAEADDSSYSISDAAFPRAKYMPLQNWLPKAITRRPSSYIKAGGSSITATDNWAKRSQSWQSPTPAMPLTASLQQRLQDLWDAPISEQANWVQHNAQYCSRERVKPQQNDFITQDSALLWASLNTTDIREKRKAMIDYLVTAESKGLMKPENCGSGRGLVFTAGNADTFSRVAVTMKILKNHYNTTLPAEIFSFPGETPPPELLPEFAGLNVTLRYIEDASRDSKRVKNYQIKSDAIVASSFAEVLYLDSDNMPAAYLGNHDGTFDPTLIDKERLIWEAPAYKRLGAMFWPDYWKTGPMNPIWSIIGTQCRDEFEQESGQIVVDKRRHMDALLLVNWMLDDWRFWFKMSDGDKDLFRFAFLALRKRWALPGRYVGAAAIAYDTMTGFCGHTMLQHDHLGYPLFVHQNLLKQIPSGIGRGSTWGRTRQTTLFNAGDPNVEGGEGGGDVEADMLANALADGTAIMPAPVNVRRRAALERGIYTRFHGGSVSALCVDMHYEDPRSPEEKAADEQFFLDHPEIVPPKYKADHGDMVEPKNGSVSHGFDAHGNTMYVHWDQSPLIVGQWGDEPNLANFEEDFYNEGGNPIGAGFT